MLLRGTLFYRNIQEFQIVRKQFDFWHILYTKYTRKLFKSWPILKLRAYSQSSQRNRATLWRLRCMDVLRYNWACLRYKI